MILTTWQLSEYNSGTGAYTNAKAVLAPNNRFGTPIRSTRTEETLVDGGLVSVKPEKHFTKKVITFIWEHTEKLEIKDIIQGYIHNDKQVKIHMNPSGGSYDGDFYGDDVQFVEGYFKTCDPKVVLGVDGKQLYQVTASFQPL